MDKIIKVGVGVMIIDNHKILLGHRSCNLVDTGGTYEPDSWTFPGGKQDYEETIVEAAIRECKEETNLDIINPTPVFITDDIEPDRHFITIGLVADKYTGNLKIMEPDKIDELKWFSIDDLPKNIYTPSKEFLTDYLKKNEI